MYGLYTVHVLSLKSSRTGIDLTRLVFYIDPSFEHHSNKTQHTSTTIRDINHLVTIHAGKYYIQCVNECL